MICSWVRSIIVGTSSQILSALSPTIFQFIWCCNNVEEATEGGVEVGLLWQWLVLTSMVEGSECLMCKWRWLVHSLCSQSYRMTHVHGLCETFRCSKQSNRLLFVWVQQHMIESHPCLCGCEIVISHSFPYFLPEWAVSLSGGLWHGCDVFCCCVNHKASCSLLLLFKHLKKKQKKNQLLSFPLN